MNQGTFIAGALVGGFVLFIAARGRLPVYGAVLWGDTQAAPPSGGVGKSGGGLLGSIVGAGVKAGIGAIAGG